MFVFLMMGCGQGANTTSITVMSTYLGNEVTCDILMNEEIKASSGTEVEAEADTYIVKVGSTPIAGDVPLCESSRGALIRPPMTIVLSEGEAAQIEAPMNRYVSGLWTCRNEAGQSVTDVARYLGGQFLSMPGVMLDMTVEGNNVTYEDDAVSVTGTIDEEYATFDLGNSANDSWRITCTHNAEEER
ncbi:MAG: hypothetical protein UY72_C0003G0009 [Candidatus Uhrbacteria bacterium GW2011_GWD2_52_7]|uniref:Uncharacterized protein n=1 Tax=Candidatus Uhrbacteria bacterium GW2011_GWD2_52_7 TaxID=1618989 RepID=A0A0G1XIP4_9BACT|nr:MAG: hypothetical protein UY72_C0003G0009 [Candidatus Uhrbacteria bacterium GW2011_GWD2_52_7]